MATMTEIPKHADAIIIGAGIAGTATAWYLAQKGIKAVVCEKGRIAGEQSSRNWGFVRQQGRDAAEIPLMMEANRIWRGLERELNADLEWRAGGNMVVFRGEEDRAQFEKWMEHAQAHGLDSRLVDPSEIQQIAPGTTLGRYGGTAFLNASSAAPFTLPSHASLLTGLLPPRHGAVNGATDALDPTGVPYLPHLLAERGWHTVAWTGGGMMSAQYGFASGFDSFRAFDPVNTHLIEGPLLPPRPPYDAALEQRVEGLQIEALPRSLAAFGDEPWFAFLHTFAAHNYTTPEEDLAAVVPGPHRGWGQAFVQVNEYVRFWRDMGVEAERVTRLRDLYDASLHHLDRRLGAFLEELDAAGLLDDTLVVLFSDHGEEFAEHGGLMHGNTLYQEMLHVPLVLRGPGLPAGRRVAESVTLTDVLPTVLELLGVPAPADLDGRSLVPLLGDQRRSPGQPPRMVGHVATSRASGMSYRSGRWKLVRMRRVLDDGSTTIRWSLYDLSQDPGETADLAGRRPDVVERLRQSLEQLERDQAAEGVEGGRALIDPALAEQLQALGYADFVPGEDR